MGKLRPTVVTLHILLGRGTPQLTLHQDRAGRLGLLWESDVVSESNVRHPRTNMPLNGGYALT